MQIIYFFPTDFPNRKSHTVQALNTALAWARQGVSVELIARKVHGATPEILSDYGLDPHPNFVLRQFAGEGSRLNRMSGRAFRWALRALILRRRLTRPDTVYYARGTGTALALLRTMLALPRAVRGPVVFEVHGIQHHDLEQTHRGRYGEGPQLEAYRRARRAAEASVYPRLDGIITLTGRLYEMLRQEFAVAAPALIAGSGVRLPEEPPLPLPGRELEICYVGGLYDFNGLDVALRALARLPERSLTIIGEGESDERQRLEYLAAELDVAPRVRFLGFRPHPEALAAMRRARVLLAPLRAVGTNDRVHWCSPGKVIEYMAAGGAIVASRLGSLAEVLRDGENALLVPPDDPAALADAVSRLLADESFAARLAAQAWIDAQGFSFDARARRILDFLNALPHS